MLRMCVSHMEPNGEKLENFENNNFLNCENKKNKVE